MHTKYEVPRLGYKVTHPHTMLPTEMAILPEYGYKIRSLYIQ